MEYHWGLWASFTKSQPTIKQLFRKVLLPTSIPNLGDLRQRTVYIYSYYNSENGVKILDTG